MAAPLPAHETLDTPAEQAPEHRSAGPANRFSPAALAGTLLLALLLCAAGAAVVWREPPTPPKHHAPRTVRHAAPAPRPVAPNGSRVVGTITAVDQRAGAIRLRIGDQQYVYHLDYRTIFPACLTRDGLRAGQTVTLSLPWYLSDNVYVQAIAPLTGCATPSRQAPVIPHTDDSPPSGTGR
ncbi:MAG TPA: hypothetical protein VHB98_14620 [Chloroflexota bacterium]|jgi:hypothetical protein|nr:hypothetical protein [Chloroflexota bacterium]